MKFKAYVVPSTKVGNKIENAVLKTELVAHIAAGNSASSHGYLIRGERKWVEGEGFFGRFFGSVNYHCVEHFYEDVKKRFSGKNDITDEEVEAFAKKKGLEAEKLLFSD